MPLARLDSITFIGLEPILVDVEIDITESDKPNLVIVGLPDAVVRESKDRVLAAIKNSGFARSNNLYITVNLAPGSIRKEGTVYDLPIAIGLLHTLGVISTQNHSNFLIM